MNKQQQFEVVPVEPKLSKEDKSFLEAREKTILGGLEKFFAVGKALLEIRDYKQGVLFAEYGSFEKYCRQRWGIGQSQAYRLMGEAKIVMELSPMGEKGDIQLPTTGRQVRPLAVLKKPEDRKAAWEHVLEVNKGKQITGELVKKSVTLKLKDGAERRSKEDKGGGAGAKKKKRTLLVKDLNAMKTKLGKISALANGNSEIGKLITEIKELLS